MAIRVRHEAPLEVAGQLAAGIGQAQGAQQGLALDADRMKFLIQMGQRDKEFDVNTQLRANDQAFDRQRFWAGLAQDEARQQRLLVDQQQRRQAALMERQMAGEQQLLAQQQEQMFQWATQGAQSIDEQLKGLLKQANELELTPEGQRLKNEWMGKVRQAQAQRGTLRPDAYQNVLAQAMQQYEDLGLDAYTVKQPSPEEMFGQSVIPLNGQQYQPGMPLPAGKYLYINGERNGRPSFAELEVPETETPVTTAERLERDMVALPNGQWGVYNPDKKTWDFLDPPEAKKAEEEKPLLPASDRDTFYKSIRDALRKEWEADLEEEMKRGPAGADGKPGAMVGTGKFKHPEGLTFQEYFRKHWKDEVATFNEMFGEQDTETLVPDEVRSKGFNRGTGDLLLRPQIDRTMSPQPDAISTLPEVAGEVPEDVIQEFSGEPELKPGERTVTDAIGRTAIVDANGNVVRIIQ